MMEENEEKMRQENEVRAYTRKKREEVLSTRCSFLVCVYVCSVSVGHVACFGGDLCSLKWKNNRSHKIARRASGNTKYIQVFMYVCVCMCVENKQLLNSVRKCARKGVTYTCKGSS